MAILLTASPYVHHCHCPDNHTHNYWLFAVNGQIKIINNSDEFAFVEEEFN